MAGFLLTLVEARFPPEDAGAALRKFCGEKRRKEERKEQCFQIGSCSAWKMVIPMFSLCRKDITNSCNCSGGFSAGISCLMLQDLPCAR